MYEFTWTFDEGECFSLICLGELKQRGGEMFPDWVESAYSELREYTITLP